MSAWSFVLLAALAALAPVPAAAQREIVITGDAMPPPQPSVAELGGRTDARTGRDARAVVIQRRCGPVSGDNPQSSRPTGEVHVSRSTVGATQAGGTICLPIGRRGDVVLGGDAVKVDPSEAPRRPGWP